jgi:hypothetical protein
MSDSLSRQRSVLSLRALRAERDDSSWHGELANP